MSQPCEYEIEKQKNIQSFKKMKDELKQKKIDLETSILDEIAKSKSKKKPRQEKKQSPPKTELRITRSRSKVMLPNAENIKGKQSEIQTEAPSEKENENRNSTIENCHEKQRDTSIRPPDCPDVLLNCEDDGIPEIDEFVLHNLERRKQVLQEEATESNTTSVMKQLSGD